MASRSGVKDDAVHSANHRANRADNQDDQRTGMVAISETLLLAFFHIDCSNVAATTAASPYLTPRRQVRPLGDDESRHAQRDNNTYRRLRQNIT